MVQLWYWQQKNGWNLPLEIDIVASSNVGMLNRKHWWKYEPRCIANNYAIIVLWKWTGLQWENKFGSSCCPISSTCIVQNLHLLFAPTTTFCVPNTKCCHVSCTFVHYIGLLVLDTFNTLLSLYTPSTSSNWVICLTKVHLGRNADTIGYPFFFLSHPV